MIREENAIIPRLEFVREKREGNFWVRVKTRMGAKVGVIGYLINQNHSIWKHTPKCNYPTSARIVNDRFVAKYQVETYRRGVGLLNSSSYDRTIKSYSPTNRINFYHSHFHVCEITLHSTFTEYHPRLYTVHYDTKWQRYLNTTHGKRDIPTSHSTILTKEFTIFVPRTCNYSKFVSLLFMQFYIRSSGFAS